MGRTPHSWRWGHRAAPGRARTWLLDGAAVFGAFLLLAELSYLFVFPPEKHALFWVPSGLTLALLLRTAPARWPAFLGGIFLAELAVVLRHGLPVPVGLAWAFVADLSPLLGALLLRRPAGPAFGLRSIQDVVGLTLLGSLLGPLPGALLAQAARVAWLGGDSYGRLVLSWWSSDSLGVLLFSPFCLAWAEPSRPHPGRLPEALLLAGLLTGLGWGVFSSTSPRDLDGTLPFFLLPLAAWAALRFGTRGATAATVGLDLVATWQTLHGRGPFGRMEASLATQILNVQAYVVFLSLFILLLAVVVLGEQRARTAAQQSEQRARLLAAASARLAESLDFPTSLAALSRLCVRSLSDWCLIDVVEGGHLRRLGGAHRDPAQEERLQQLQARYPPGKDSPQPAARVLRTGEPVLLAQLSAESIRAHSVDEQNARLIRELGTRSAMAVPLAVRGQILGVLSLGSTEGGQPYGPQELELATELGRRAALAVDNARLYRDAQEAIRLRDEFLSVASHELKTPLTSLQLTLQALRKKAQPDSSALSLSRAEHQVKKLARLIDQLVDVSLVTAGSMHLEIETLDLHDLAQEVAAGFGEEVTRAGSPLTLHTEVGVEGRWDRRRLEQVLTILLSNALKFGAGRPIDLSLVQDGGTARLTVRDQGIGIPPDRLPHIFGRFERAVPARSYGGLGLGLYIARFIVEALGGTIRAEATPGGGATFVVELPCAGPPATRAAQEVREEPGSFAPPSPGPDQPAAGP